jgi:hypothetical protein
MTFTCEECGSRTRGEPQLSITGRSLCPDCYQVLLGLSAGLLAGRGDAGGGGVSGAIGTAGAFVRLKEWGRRRRRG